MKFRYHRGSLEDSLATTQEFNINKLAEDYFKDFSDPIATREHHEFVINYYGYDDRCNQELWSVAVRDMQMRIYTIGFIWEE